MPAWGCFHLFAYEQWQEERAKCMGIHWREGTELTEGKEQVEGEERQEKSE